jgi:hypothetical protein
MLELDMSEVDVALLESSLGVVLPDHYRRFLLNYPSPLIDNKRDLGWVREAPAERQLLNGAARLIHLNRDVRLPGTPWVGESGDPWPDNFFVVGDDQCGNFWCVNMLAEDRGVWFYDHDLGGFQRHHESLAEFGELLLLELTELNREHGRGDRDS